MIVTAQPSGAKTNHSKLAAAIALLVINSTAGVSYAVSTCQAPEPPATVENSVNLIRTSLNQAGLAGLPTSAVDAFARSIVAQTTVYRRVGLRTEKILPSRAAVLEFVRAPSPTLPDVFLYALRVEVTVTATTDAQRGRSICQGLFTTNSTSPTVVCDPVRFGD